MNGLESIEVSQSFVHALEDIASQPDFDQQLNRLVELAQKTVGFGEAAVWTIKSSGGLGLGACTNVGLAKALTSLQKAGIGPVQDCFEYQHTVEIEDFCSDLRWPAFTATLLDTTPVRSAMAYFLGSPSRPVGVLAFLASTPLDPRSRQLAAVYAGLSAQTLDAAIQADKAHHLELALASNRRIGIAIGIVMALQGLDEGKAFAALREASQSLQCKLREIAEWVLMTGQVPTTRT